MAFLQMRDQRKLYYEEEGTGRPVVLIHGWKATSDVYLNTSRGLAEAGWRAIRYDQCGHKRSEVPAVAPTLETLADDLHEVITQLKLEKPILVGWSMGGATIYEYIRRYGCEALDRVVFVDIPPRSVNDEIWKIQSRNRPFTREEAIANVEHMRTDFCGFLRNYYIRGVPGFREKSEAEQSAIVCDRMAGFDCTVLTSLMDALYRRDHRDVLPTITCPSAVFYAELLPACSAEAAQYCAEHIPGPCKTVFFQNASHSLITEQPEKFLRELLDFFEEEAV